MSSPAERPPHVERDRTGILPRHVHLFLVLGLAGLMLGATFLARRRGAKTDPAEAVSERKQDVDELQRRLREQTQRELAALEARERSQPLQPEPSPLPTLPPDIYVPAPPRSWGEAGGGVGAMRQTSSLALSYRQRAGDRPTPRMAGGEAMGDPGFAEYLNVMLQKEGRGEQPAQAEARPPTEGRNRAVGRGHVLFEGTVLETALLNRLNADFSGPVITMVTTDVLSHNGKTILVPAGSRVIGGAKKVEAFGQSRVAVAFHRLLMPDGYSVDLRQFVGLNQQGDVALKDKVNHHYLQLFGAAAAVGALGGLLPAGQVTSRQGIVPSVGQEAMHILDRFLNVLPSITIREGHRVRVYITQDLTLPAYDQHRMPKDL